MKESSSAPLVILVVLITLLGGGAAFYVLKMRAEAEEHVQFTGEGFTTVAVKIEVEKYSLSLQATAVDKVSDKYSLQADLFGSKGELCYFEEFEGGSGLDILSAGKSDRKEGGPDLIELPCGEAGTQYYRVLGDRLVLVRLEDSQGRLIRNS